MLPRNEKEQFLFKKAYEVSYALFRIAERLKEKNFSGKLYESAAELLSSSLAFDDKGMARALDAATGFLSFGNDVNLIGGTNVDIVLAEIQALELALAEWRSEKMADNELDLSSVFAAVPPVSQEEVKTAPQSVREERTHGPSVRNPVLHREESGSAETRHSAILEKIRQIGNCRLKDLQEILPQYSERTIRYDLQSLAEKNLIERIGNGGPAVFYRIRQTA